MDKTTKEIELDFGADSFKQIITKSSKLLAESLNKDLQQTFKSLGKSFAEQLASPFKTLFNDTISEMKSMLEYSQLSNSSTRNLAFKYGFSSSQAYGYSQAMSMLGFQSEEDLFYANTQELQQFRQAFEKYSNYYTNLYDSGFFTKMQEYQFEMADFRQELQMKVATFFVDNKDIIKAGMQALMEISKLVLKLVSFFVGNSNKVASTSDIVNQYNQTSSSNKNVSTNINNTFNGVAKQDETYLANAGSLTYQQVIRALGGEV